MVDLLPYEELAVALFKNALVRSSLAIRRPSNTDPTFWSDTLTRTNIVPLAAGDGWVDVLTIVGNPTKTTRVASYVASCIGDAALALIEYRFILNGQLAPNMELAAGAENNKISAGSYPTIPQATYFLVEEQDRLILQARTTAALQQMAVAAFYGWVYNNPNPADSNKYEFITDVS